MRITRSYDQQGTTLSLAPLSPYRSAATPFSSSGSVGSGSRTRRRTVSSEKLMDVYASANTPSLSGGRFRHRNHRKASDEETTDDDELEQGAAHTTAAKYRPRQAQHPRRGAWAMGLLVILGLVLVHLRLHVAHNELSKSHEETNKLLDEMEWLHKRAKYNANYNANIDLSSRIAQGLVGFGLGGSSGAIDAKAPSGKKAGDVQDLQEQVHVLKETLQDAARDQLQAAFPSFPDVQAATLETEIHLEAMPSPLVFTVFQKELPYAVWVFLDQVRRGHWDNVARLTHVGNDDFIEIRTALSSPDDTPTDTRIRKSLLHFKEHHQTGREKFVVGIRNPPSGADHGLILSIHLTQGSCGTTDPDEVCFGKITGGFDSLRVIRTLQAPLNEAPLKVRKMNVRE